MGRRSVISQDFNLVWDQCMTGEAGHLVNILQRAVMHGQTTVHSLLSTASGCTAVICSSDGDLHAGECYHGDNLHGHG